VEGEARAAAVQLSSTARQHCEHRLGSDVGEKASLRARLLELESVPNLPPPPPRLRS
jgi:hypothetical protein